MGMSTHVVAIKPPDDKWLQMKAIWDACTQAGVSVPDEVYKFFDGEKPDPKGVFVRLDHSDYDKSRNHPSVSHYNPADGSEVGFDIDLTKLPDDVKIIRFWNSW